MLVYEALFGISIGFVQIWPLSSLSMLLLRKSFPPGWVFWDAVVNNFRYSNVSSFKILQITQVVRERIKMLPQAC